MKKLLAVLLALSLATVAFAQVTTTVGASGTVTLYDTDGMASFARDGSGYDLLTFKAAKDNVGFSATVDNFLNGSAFATAFRDWNAWYKGQFTKTIVGKVRNGDFRTLLPNGYLGNYLGATQRFFGGAAYGLIIESTTLEALTLGLGLPITETAAEFGDVVQQSEIGVKYAIEGAGTVAALFNLDLVNDSNVINLGFNYTGMENLAAAVLLKVTMATDTTIAFGLGAEYTMDALTVSVEFDGQNATEFDFEADVRADYAITEKMTAGVGFDYFSDGAMIVAGVPESYDAWGSLGYDYGNGLSSDITVGYNGEVYYSVSLGYSFSF